MATLAAAPPSSGRYNQVSIVLHWTIALLIIGNLAGGLLMGNLLDSPDAELKQLGFRVIQWHKAIGLTVLTLSLVRLTHRLIEGFPALPAHMKDWERVLARITHYGFYALMIGVPLAGWAMVSASPLDFPIRWFDLFTWPQLPLATDAALAGRLNAVHEYLAYTTIGLLALHVAGALKHHFVDRDQVLLRILPWGRRA